ncbi:MAG: hypothetical protein ACC661_00605, partial [Verrucomicrobiales bacterium]
MNFSRYLLPCVALAVAATLPGCGGEDPKKEARTSVDALFDAIKRTDYNSALALYSPVFFASTPAQEWAKILQSVQQRYGLMQSFQVLSIVPEKRSGPQAGMYVAFICNVTYQRATLRENVVLVKPTGMKSYSITAHTITAQDTGNAQPAQQPQPQAQPRPQQPPPTQQPQAPQAQPQPQAPGMPPTQQPQPQAPQAAIPPATPTPAPAATPPATPAPTP